MTDLEIRRLLADYTNTQSRNLEHTTGKLFREIVELKEKIKQHDQLLESVIQMIKKIEH